MASCTPVFFKSLAQFLDVSTQTMAMPYRPHSCFSLDFPQHASCAEQGDRQKEAPYPPS